MCEDNEWDGKIKNIYIFIQTEKTRYMMWYVGGMVRWLGFMHCCMEQRHQAI